MSASGAVAKTVKPTAIVANGSFETGVPGKVKGLVNRANFDLLNVSGPSSDIWRDLDDWKLKSGYGIEVQTDRTSSTIDAQDGDYYVELDSLSNSSMTQKVKLSKGSYLLSFWYSPRTSNAATNTIAYNLGRVVSGQITAGQNGARVGIWTEVRVPFAITSKGNYDLVLAAQGLSDGVGGLIDNVTIETVPVPAAGLSLLAGLGLLGWTKRRRAVV